MMHWVGGFNRFGWMGGGFMMMLWPLVIGLIFYFTFRSSRRFNTHDSYSALEILNEKFASGEITEQEYLHKKKILSK